MKRSANGHTNVGTKSDMQDYKRLVPARWQCHDEANDKPTMWRYVG